MNFNNAYRCSPSYETPYCATKMTIKMLQLQCYWNGGHRKQATNQRKPIEIGWQIQIDSNYYAKKRAWAMCNKNIYSRIRMFPANSCVWLHIGHFHFSKKHFPFRLGIATNCRSNIKSNNNKTPRSVHSQREHKAARSSELHIIHNINA